MEFWEKVISKLEKDRKVILLLVVSHQGSSPGKQGFKMLVADDGYIFGSIGGGRTEYEMVELARKIIEKNDTKPFFKNQIHREDEDDSSGMICTGEQLVLFYPMDKTYLNTIKNVLKNNQGVLTISENKFEYENDDYVENDFYFQKIGDWWKYQENVNRKSRIFIIGGGHVSLAVSKLFSTLDFEITIIENRKNINTFEENSYADKKIIIDYKMISEYIPEGKKNFILILTHGYNTDRLILGQLINRDYKYIGMLGSKAKVKQTFNTLKKEGFSIEQMNNIDAPVGMSINSKTPAEIAVSIAAKIISISNKN